MPRSKEIEKGIFEFVKPEILVFTLTKPQPTKEDILEYEQAVIELLTTAGHQLVMVYDASATEWASFETRATFGQVVKDLDLKFQHQVPASHIVVPNTMTKLILKGINIIAKPIIKQNIYNSKKDAMRAAEEQVSTWHVTTPQVGRKEMFIRADSSAL
jgi:hypothetical protein